MMSEDAAAPLGATDVSRRALPLRRIRISAVAAGGTLFIGGWALMWAAALGLIELVSARQCAVLVVAGLGITAYALWADKRRAAAAPRTPAITS